MRRKNRGIKLHDIHGWAMRMLNDWNREALMRMSDDDRFDLETRFAGRLLGINFNPRIFL